MDMPPRAPSEPFTKVHEDLAFEAQRVLEETVLAILAKFAKQTRLPKPLYRRRRAAST